MPIIRVDKRDGNFTQINNQTLRDKRLSWKARGLLAFLLSFPNDWEFNTKYLEQQSDLDGKVSLANAMKELESLTYLARERTRKNGKIDGITYVIREIPEDGYLQAENLSEEKIVIEQKLQVENLIEGKLDVENSAHTNNDQYRILSLEKECLNEGNAIACEENANANAIATTKSQVDDQENIPLLINKDLGSDQVITAACSTNVVSDTTKVYADPVRDRFKGKTRSQQQQIRDKAKSQSGLIEPQLEDEFWAFLQTKGHLTEDNAEWVFKACTGRKKDAPTPKERGYIKEFLDLRASKQPKVQTQATGNQQPPEAQETEAQRKRRELDEYIKRQVVAQATARLNQKAS